MRIKDRSTVYLYSISICMGSFVLGYELTSYSQLTHIIAQANSFSNLEDYTSTTTLLSSLLALTAIFGVSAYRCIVSSFGYLKTFKYLDYITIFAVIVGASNLSVSTQILSRLLLGLVVGVNTIAIPVYLTSCLPGSMGGPAGTLNQLFITIGILFGYLMSLTVIDATASDFAWRVVIALPVIPSAIRIYTTQYVFPYETVQMMIQTGNDSLLWKYIQHIWEEVTIEEFKQSKKLDEEDVLSQTVPSFETASQPYARRMNMAAFIIFFNQFSGSSTSFAFALSIFPTTAGWQTVDTVKTFVYLALVQVVVTYLAGQFLQKYGRRSFMMEGQRIIIVTNVLFGLIELGAPELKQLEYILLFVHIIGFSLSFGPCSFVIITEILHDITYPSILFWILIFAFGLLNQSLLQYYGPAALFLFLSTVSLIGLFYIGCYLVQTQGKSRREVYREFRSTCFPLPVKWKQFLTKRHTADRQLQDNKLHTNQSLIARDGNPDRDSK